MANQIVSSTPFQSTHFKAASGRLVGPALRARLRSAQLGSVKQGPPCQIFQGVVQKIINGMARCDAAASLQYQDYLPNGAPASTFPRGENYAPRVVNGVVTNDGPILLRGFSSLLDVLTKSTDLYQSCTDTFTDNSDPTQNFTGTSSLAGTGNTPQSTCPPIFGGANMPWYEWRPSAYEIGSPFTFNGGSETTFGIINPSDGSNLQRVLSGQVDCNSQYKQALAALNAHLVAQSFFSFAFNEVQAFPSFDCTGVDPGTYDGSLIQASNSPSIGFTLPNTANSGWLLNNEFAGGAAGNILQKGQIKLPIGNRAQKYWIGHCLAGNGAQGTANCPILSTDIKLHIDFVSAGVIQPGQTIGPANESDIALPYPDSEPFPIAALGTNGVISEFYFAVIGISPQAYTTGFRLKFGDNFF